MGSLLNINVVEIGIFILAAGYLYTTWKQGGLKASAEVITAYREQVNLNAGKISELTHDLGVLTGQLKEKDERIKLLEALVQGRSPEQQQYMADMRTFTQGVATYMDHSTKTMGEICIFMKEINKK